MDVPVLARVQRQTVAPHGRVALGQPYDIARHQQFTGFVPHRHIDAGGRVGHLKCPHLTTLLGQRGGAHLQHDEDDVDVFEAGPDVLDWNVVDMVRMGICAAGISVCVCKQRVVAIGEVMVCCLYYVRWRIRTLIEPFI